MGLERLFLWIAFNVFVLGMLAVDLGFFHRKAHAISIKEASIWSVVWIFLALVFNLVIYHLWGQEKALEFLTGYLIEKSLSIDNLFVFLMIFHYFATPAMYQHRVLFWGILGALIMRAIFIAAGAALLENFHWMMYVFGAFLIVTGIKMLQQGDHKIDPKKNPALRLLQRLMPIANEYHDQRFVVRKAAKYTATPLLLVLVVVETTDVIFAVDSIPAIFAITRDPFIVYTSNVFAILGLRALYFLLAGIMEMFRYLKVGLSLVLCFVGIKMMVIDLYEIPVGASLAIVAAILGGTVIASILPQWRDKGILRKPLHMGFFAKPSKNLSPEGALSEHNARLWGLLGVVGLVLIVVKWSSIQTGPSWHNAVTAIRVAELESAETKWTDGQAAHVRVQHAEAALSQAWLSLEQDRYEDAILAAKEAQRLLRGPFK
jgi:tellurite resistance protein TerC